MINIRSHAKINLNLIIKKKLKNGLHSINSLYSLIKIYDIIQIKRINGRKDNILFKGKFSKGISKKNNSVKHVMRLLRNNQLIKDYFNITITKNIPTFSGLGGGSSNAAKIFNYFVSTKKRNFYLNIFAKEIGTDFLLFSQNQGYQKNLYQINKIKKKMNYQVLLVYPKINCSTKYIYSKYKFVKLKKSSKKSNFQKKEVDKYIQSSRNDLQRIAENKFPKIAKLRNTLENQEGCIVARMTGSGSVCYALFKRQLLVKKAHAKLKKFFPGYWCVITKTI